MSGIKFTQYTTKNNIIRNLLEVHPSWLVSCIFIEEVRIHLSWDDQHKKMKFLDL